ncbi:MAG TPA: amidase family protein, partial [Chloroflexota bacterium]
MLTSQSIGELRKLLSLREVSALEIARAHLDRIEALDNSTVHSLLTLTREHAEEQARRADARLAAGDDAPLLGIPVILKDVLTTRGIRTTAGSRILEHFVPVEDATITRRLAEGGCVLLGKSNMDEFAMG